MPPPEDTKEAFDWKQGAPSGTVLLPLQIHKDDNQLHLERFGSRLAAMIDVSIASVNAAGFWECYAEFERQQLTAGQSVACGEFASGDFTSGHSPLCRTA